MLVLCMFLLAACSAQEQLPVVATETVVVAGGCDGARGPSESCATDCDCARPLSCLNGACRATKLQEGDLCSENAQCASRYCTESGRCGGPDGPNLSYSCEKECKDRWTGEPLPCNTVCRER